MNGYRFIMEIVKYIWLCDIIHKEILLLYFHRFLDKKTTNEDNFCQDHKTRWFTSMYFSFLLDILLWPVLLECKIDFYWAKLDWFNAYFFSLHIHLLIYSCWMRLSIIFKSLICNIAYLNSVQCTSIWITLVVSGFQLLEWWSCR